ncbi:MAG TPA: hypothetical protein DDY21_00055 [Candidatus Moranbacteria bacterium]|nr:hypothetical protein [Candidatus Moranbacteria bacterium]
MKKYSKEDLKNVFVEATYTKLKLQDLKPAKYNPRIITDSQLDHLEASMAKGILQPIVVNKDMTIIGGHQRYRVLTDRTEKEEIVCAVVDVDKKTEKELNLAMNQISGFWNEDLRNELVYELRDSNIPGFDEEEKQQILLQREMMLEKEGSYDPDEDEEIKSIFARNEKVPVKIEEPEAMHRKDQLAFYTESFEEYDKIRNFFKSSRQGELDKNKLLELL